MNKNNPGTYISISRKEEAYSAKWKEILKIKIKKHLNDVNLPFSEDEYAQAVWNRTLVSITLSGIKCIVYII